MSKHRILLALGIALAILAAAFAVTAFAQVGPMGGALILMDTPSGGGGCTNSFNFAQACNSMYGGGKVLF